MKCSPLPLGQVRNILLSQNYTELLQWHPQSKAAPSWPGNGFLIGHARGLLSDGLHFDSMTADGPNRLDLTHYARDPFARTCSRIVEVHFRSRARAATEIVRAAPSLRFLRS